MSQFFSGALFWAMALIFLGLGLAMAYEGYAIVTGKESTISAISAGAIQSHPIQAIVFASVFFFILGALTAHFTRWNP